MAPVQDVSVAVGRPTQAEDLPFHHLERQPTQPGIVPGLMSLAPQQSPCLELPPADAAAVIPTTARPVVAAMGGLFLVFTLVAP